jgi:uncharacterized repeat protein (TIGR03803 family)
MSAILTTLVTFNGADGADPQGSLIVDANGDLFGTTNFGGEGENNAGTVFEIVKTSTGYASSPVTLVNFDDAVLVDRSVAGLAGANPAAGLIADASGDLFGTASGGGADGEGTVFEIAKTPAGYASTPTALVTFNGADGRFPAGDLIADANGDLFGTTAAGGPNDDGTAFEIAKTPTGYASTPTTLVNFDSADGADPTGSLIADANGDLFGTTNEGGPNDDGTVFEIVKTPTGYASTPVTLVNFNFADGASPRGSLIADANGDLFGTTSSGGANNEGTVFEIVKTPAGYASNPVTLVNFDGLDGGDPLASLIADGNGDLFGTTSDGGDLGQGTVFEIAKTSTGYASAATTLASLGSPFADLSGSLIADANGDLFGTTKEGGGAGGQGTVFEITDSGFVPVTTPPPPLTGSHDILFQNTSTGQASIWEMDGTTRTGGGAISPNPGTSWRAVGTGDFNHDGLSDILWQNADGQASIWEMNGNTRIGGGTAGPNPGPTWKAVGTGDFYGNGIPTSCGRTRARARCRSGKWTGTPGSAAAQSTSIPGRFGKRLERAISTATGIPTSFSRTRARARSRSGRWTATPGSAAARSLPSPGRVGTRSEPTAAVPTSCSRTRAPAKPRFGRWTATPRPPAGRSASMPGPAGARSA